MPSLRSCALATFCAGLVLGCAGGARADYLFSFSSSVRATSSPDLPSALSDGSSSTVAIGSSGSLMFTTNQQQAVNGGLPGGADINFGRLAFLPGSSAAIDHYLVSFSYTIRLTDGRSGASGDVHFTGKVAGFAQGSSASINGAIFNFEVSPALLWLGGQHYSITARPSTGPGSGGQAGVLQGRVSVVPEPASIGLIALGGIALGAAYRRRSSRGRNRA